MALPRESHSREIQSIKKSVYERDRNNIVELHAPTHGLLALYIFEPRTGTEREFFSYLTFFTLPPLSIFSLVEMISLKIW